MSLVEQVANVFTPEGPLARQIPAFKARAQQIEMAERIADAITANAACLVEAGTGTGKTFAYLVPAMLAGGKVVLSTGTKTLQDQLFERDIPTVREALGAPISVALLKGRSNYLCKNTLSEPAPVYLSADERDELRRVWDAGVERLDSATGIPFAADISQTAVFMQDEWSISERWSLLPGLRVQEVRTRSSDGSVGCSGGKP